MPSETDFKALGLKCGLEVHQQLDTGKLFCRTPSLLREGKADYTVSRKLRPVVSELGEYDAASLEAFRKGLEYVYEGFDDSISLVELDEEPPQPIDGEALKISLEVALLCKSQVLDQLFVMRKAVIDGSNTSGFQRTMLVATGGKIRLKNKELGVQTIVLEEDAARPVEKTGAKIVYRLDRLGIPLIELATEPGIETPEEAKEAARAIGEILRITGKVKRGLGTIRQDINISIARGARVEIKGVQDLQIIDEYVRREAERQLKLLEVKKELEAKGLQKNSLKAEPRALEKFFAGTESKILKGALEKGGKVFGLKLEKFSGLLGKELQPNRRLGTELADCVKVKTGLKGLFHSDELPNYGITEQEKSAVAEELGCGAQDGFVIVAGQEEKALHALEAVLEKARQCLEGVPEETRGAIEGGNTEYLRPLPGAARMYPETDLESIAIDAKELEKIRKQLPLGAEERLKLYSKWGLNEKHAQEMKLSNFARLFERKVLEGADAKKTAVFLLEALVEARRNGAALENLGEKELEEFIGGINSGKIPKEVQVDLLIEKSRKPAKPLNEIINEKGAVGAGGKEVEEAVRKVVHENIEMVKSKGLAALGPLMGDVMKELKGKASGKEISDALKKEIEKALKA